MNKLLVPLLVGSFFLFLVSCQKKKENVPNPSPQEEAPVEQVVNKLVSFTKMTAYTSKGLQSTIVLSAPELAPLAPSLLYPASVYKVVYTTHYQDRPIQASGIVCLPDTSLPFPLMSFQHGTLFQDQEVPSNDAEFQLQMAAIASLGYVSIAPDYIGFGSSLNVSHPYYVAEYSAACVKDLILATREMLDTLHVASQPQLFLAGYSQGGNVTMAAAKELEAHPIEGLPLVASGVGAGGYDLMGMFSTITSQKTFPSPNYLAYMVHSYHRAYRLTEPYSYFFQEPYASKFPFLMDEGTSADGINDALSQQVDQLLQPSFVKSVLNKDIFFVSLLALNSLHNWTPRTAIRFYHGDRDEIVPYSDSESTFQKMKARGARQVSFVPLPGRDHSGGAMLMVLDLLPWWKSLQ